jgi:hypothetical protein
MHSELPVNSQIIGPLRYSRHASSVGKVASNSLSVIMVHLAGFLMGKPS